MATNFGLANLYNVFVLGNMNMSNTDAEGRVAAGGNVTLSNYGVGAGISPLPPAGTDASLVIDGSVNISGGSNASGNTVVNPASIITAYTMGNPNGSLTTGTPIDFSEAGRYLKCASAWWGALAPNGTGAVLFGQLTLTGIDGALNIFQLDAANVYGSGLSLAQLNGINIVAPASSTILINITGPAIQFGSYQIFRNGLTATRDDAHRILWNFPDALTWSNSTTAIYGSVLAPFAAANTTYSQINGNIIFDSYSGNAESHNELFTGELPEPTACLLTTTSSSTSSTSSTTSSTSSTTSSTSSTTSSTSSTTSSTSSTTSSTSSTTSSTSSTTSSTSSTTSSTSSTTSSTSSTTSSTSSTTSSSTTTANPSLRRQAITDLFESVALQQTALSHILNAEGEKLQRIFAFDNITPETVLAANHSVESTVNAIAGLESVLEMKLRLFTDCACNPPRN